MKGDVFMKNEKDDMEREKTEYEIYLEEYERTGLDDSRR